MWAYYHHDDDAKAWLDQKGKSALLRDHRKNSLIGGGSVADRLKRNQDTKVQITPTTQQSQENAGREKSQDEDSQRYVDTLTRIMDPTDTSSTERIQKEAMYRKGSDGLQEIVREVHKSLPSQGAKNTGEWCNTFDKDHIIRIWKATSPQLLKSDEERYVYRLLHKYNGSYGAYVELALEAQKRRTNNTRLGSHVRWDVHGLIVNPDIDGRARELLEELDRAISNKNFWMDSLVLHTNDQRFPTAVLRLQLEDALDTVLADQVIIVITFYFNKFLDTRA